MVGFATGLGSFIGGVGAGIRLGREIRDVRDENEMRRIQRDATKGVSAAREKDIMSAIDFKGGTPAVAAKAGSAPADDWERLGFQEWTGKADTPAEGPYVTVGDKRFGSYAEARKHAERQVGSIADYYRTQALPKIVEGYMAQGQQARAIALQEYAESADGRARTKDWANAAQRIAMGDLEGGFKGLAKLNEALDNGVELESYAPITEEVEGEDGKKTTRETGGYRVTWKDSAVGRSFTQDFESGEDFARTALWAMAPERQVGEGLAEVRAAQAARAKAAEKGLEFAYDTRLKQAEAVLDDQRASRAHQRTIARDATQHGYKLDEQNNQAALSEAAAQAAREWETSRDRAPNAASAQEAIARITRDLLRNDAGDLDGKKRYADAAGNLTMDKLTADALEIYKRQAVATRSVLEAAEQTSDGPLLY